MSRYVTFLVAVGLALPAWGDILGNPYDAVETSGALAQDFVWPGTDPLDTWVVSDFETTVDYYLHEVTSQGWTTSSAGADGEDAIFDIYDGLPWDGGAIVLSAGNGYDTLGRTGTIGADFDSELLPAGSYYIVFQAVHNFLTPGGNTLIYHTHTGNDNDWQWNPGLGQSWGSEARPIETTEPAPIDINWQLAATPVPEPGSMILLALLGAAARRR